MAVGWCEWVEVTAEEVEVVSVSHCDMRAGASCARCQPLALHTTKGRPQLTLQDSSTGMRRSPRRANLLERGNDELEILLGLRTSIGVLLGVVRDAILHSRDGQHGPTAKCRTANKRRLGSALGARAESKSRATHCCTPGAAQVSPAEFFCNLINLTILAAAAKHFSVDTLVVGSPERRRKKGRCSWMCIML